jgi:hypothetical protein
MTQDRRFPGFRKITGLSGELMRLDARPIGDHAPTSSETLVERIGRAKARWLRRVMYNGSASSTQKCLAYAIADHLNCVTLDCWPSQFRLAKLLGFKTSKTVQRAAQGLEWIGVLTLSGGGRAGYRYGPVFMPGDEDKVVPSTGHSGPTEPDKNVSESFLVIQPNKSASTEEATEVGRPRQFGSRYERRQRGSIEIKLAEMLGQNGFDVLSRLGQIDDAIVERLCRAYASGLLGERELIAARLAAEQAK